MKRKLFLLCMMLCVLALAMPIGQAYAAEKPIKIRISLYWPPSHHLVRVAEYLGKNVENKSGGRIKFEVYPADQLYSQKESLKATAMGSIEMSDENLPKAETIDPIFAVENANFSILTDYDIAWKFVDDPLFRKTIGDAYRKIGVYPLLYGCSGTMSLLVNNKRPIIKTTDAKGLLIRVVSKTAGDRLMGLPGAKPVIMSSGEQIMALQMGTIDGAWTSVGDGFTRRIYEVAKYGTVMQLYLNSHPFVINAKFFDSLPADLRTILVSCAKDAEGYGRKLLEDEERGYVEGLKKKMNLYVLTQKDYDSGWNAAFEPMAKEWLEKTGERGKKLRERMIAVRQEVISQRK
ncbi:MAG: TRAP transporter substrate-binding protein [Deltaproteobacteria bacterium]|nr:TRAP transporter substrate-binding protein [Deltaproteobacteria bacterium]